MKTSAQVIRVSAARAREGAPSLTSWLDAVQVRPLAGSVSAVLALEPDAPADREPAAGGAERSFVGFKIL